HYSPTRRSSDLAASPTSSGCSWSWNASSRVTNRTGTGSGRCRPWRTCSTGRVASHHVRPAPTDPQNVVGDPDATFSPPASCGTASVADPSTEGRGAAQAVTCASFHRLGRGRQGSRRYGARIKGVPVGASGGWTRVTVRVAEAVRSDRGAVCRGGGRHRLR